MQVRSEVIENLGLAEDARLLAVARARNVFVKDTLTADFFHGAADWRLLPVNRPFSVPGPKFLESAGPALPLYSGDVSTASDFMGCVEEVRPRLLSRSLPPPRLRVGTQIVR